MQNKTLFHIHEAWFNSIIISAFSLPGHCVNELRWICVGSLNYSLYKQGKEDSPLLSTGAII